MNDAKKIDGLLYFLIALDVVIFIVGFFFPDFWCLVFHGTDYLESYGLLKRTASLWAAFAIFQTIALFKWRQNEFWLVLVAGMRLSEMFSDWVYAYSADQLTWFGWVALLSSPPSNIFFGYFLFQQATRLRQTT